MILGKFSLKVMGDKMMHRFCGAEDKGTGKSTSHDPNNMYSMGGGGVPFHAPIRFNFDADGAGKPEMKKGIIRK